LKKTVYIIILLVATCSCNKKDGNLEPIANFTISPEVGLTTTTFEFNSDLSSLVIPGKQLYYQWDWEGDGLWDVEVSKLNQVTHRYLAPGTYYPKLKTMAADGLWDTLSIPIVVEQGYSAPRPILRITPTSGHKYLTYVFDASLTKDDEDSLEQLQFRWDFNGDGTWDIPYEQNPIRNHVFLDTGYFPSKLQVMDPSGRSAIAEGAVTVTFHNPRIMPDFIWHPEYGTTADVFLFDATVTKDLDDPEAEFWYSWAFEPDNEWTAYSPEPFIEWQFERETNYQVYLRVKDRQGLTNQKTKEITIYHENLPPKANFILGSARGNTSTQFYFDAWPTSDLESRPTSLEIRWDFDGDGNWETGFGHEKRLYYSYSKPGRYKVMLEARDPQGLVDSTAQYVYVSNGSNETGLIFDHRDGQVYGTVKIGAQWWMSENLNFKPGDWHKDEVQRWCYCPRNPCLVSQCHVYGGLYSAWHANRREFFTARDDDLTNGICPKGWHMPSKKDWEKLIETCGGMDHPEEILIGGETDFNAIFAGYGDAYSGGGFEYKGAGSYTYFWSSTRLTAQEGVSAWALTLIKDYPTFSVGFSGNNFLMYVRCIKDQE